jgi:flagellar basal-body rod modification protein FlgD
MEINQTGLLGAGGGSKAVKSSATLAQNFDNFLTLLTTQLQHQDPLSPLESTEFTNQLVQFASVEQQVAQNQQLEEMIALQRRDQAVNAVSFLGTVIEAFGNEALLDGGNMTIGYTLLPDTASVTISILDDQDREVRAFEGDTEPGKHTLVWDGINDQGLPAPDGAYTIRVTARNADGDPMDSATSINGTVSAVIAEDGAIVLKIGEISVPLDRVVGVTAATAPLPASGSGP